MIRSVSATLGISIKHVLLKPSATMATAAEWKDAKSIYEFTADDIDGNPTSLDKYKGKVVLIVNVASK
jgi:cytochrome oxidase Cu insertion factor (SCO1/SenC/PrrC family)